MSRTVIFLVLLAIACLCTSSVSAKCPANEVFKACGSLCEPKCGRRNPTYCPEECVPDVCQCAPNYFRNSKNKCVLAKEC
ncbi:unnamed protein product [Xylocopa violacea]|uniref:TIL domain-containing protein n=1 Tax=Xylocopa violacea TaxID=135666 RepID=A0ABP1P2H1_XYLVO